MALKVKSVCWANPLGVFFRIPLGKIWIHVKSWDVMLVFYNSKSNQFERDNYDTFNFYVQFLPVKNRNYFWIAEHFMHQKLHEVNKAIKLSLSPQPVDLTHEELGAHGDPARRMTLLLARLNAMQTQNGQDSRQPLQNSGEATFRSGVLAGFFLALRNIRASKQLSSTQKQPEPADFGLSQRSQSYEAARPYEQWFSRSIRSNTKTIPCHFNPITCMDNWPEPQGAQRPVDCSLPRLQKVHSIFLPRLFFCSFIADLSIINDSTTVSCYHFCSRSPPPSPPPPTPPPPLRRFRVHGFVLRSRNFPGRKLRESWLRAPFCDEGVLSFQLQSWRESQAHTLLSKKNKGLLETCDIHENRIVAFW